MRATSLPALLLAALALLLGACGGDDGDSSTSGSDSDYTAELDTLCSDQQEFFQTLPQRQQEEKLSFEEIDEIATESGEKFIADVGALEPPEDLADQHETLVDLLETDPTTDSTTPDQYYGDLADTYAALGADGCEAIARESQKLITQSG